MQGKTIKVYSKEMYDAMDYFERGINKVVFMSCDFQKEDKSMWSKGHYYCNGKLNDLFLVFLFGYSYGVTIGLEKAQD